MINKSFNNIFKHYCLKDIVGTFINSSITNEDIKNYVGVRRAGQITAETTYTDNAETKTTSWTADKDYPKAILDVTCDGTIYHSHTVKLGDTKILDNVSGGGAFRVVSINKGDKVTAIATVPGSAAGTKCQSKTYVKIIGIYPE